MIGPASVYPTTRSLAHPRNADFGLVRNRERGITSSELNVKL